MSLRDFNTPSDERTVILHHEPMGNGSGLSSFHTVSPEERHPNNTGKMVGALAVALMVGGAGLYAYTASSPANNPQPVAVAANTPAPPPAQPAPMMAPAADTTTADAAPVAEPALTPAPVATPAPVRSARVASPAAPAISEGAAVRMGADSQAVTTQPTQQAEVTPTVPEPVSPTPSPSDVAVASPTPGVSVPADATTAQDIAANAQTEAMPSAEAAAPAQAQPEQSAGQVAQ
jgi:hypothetical protein